MRNTTRMMMVMGKNGIDSYINNQKAIYSSAISFWPFYEASGAVAANVMGNTGNLVYNPGFEYAGAGGADIWANWTETAGSGAIADEAVDVHAGGHAAKITAGATANTTVAATLKVKPSTTYSFSVWTHGDGTYAGRYLIYDSTNSAILVNHTTTGITGATYTLFSGTFTTAAGCVAISFRLECPSANGGIAYFDDFTVTGAIGCLDAAYVNCATKQNGMGDGHVCPTFAGTNDYINLISAPLVNLFNPAEFGIKFWYNPLTGLGTDGASHVLFRVTADANNYILVYKVDSPNNTIYAQYVAGGTSKAATITLADNAWVELKMSVSKSADELKAYIDGVQVGATLTGLGTWTTTVLINTMLFGANTVTPTLLWKGGGAHLLMTGPFEYPAGRLRIPVDAADVDSSGNIYAGRGATIYKSTDGGDVWTNVYTVPGSPTIMGRVYVDSNDYVYVSGRSGASDYGLYRSVDGGANWTLVLSTAEGTVWGIDEDASGNLYCGLHGFNLGAATVQIWKSPDGETWTKKFDQAYTSGMSQCHVHDLRFDSRTGYIYATIGDQTNERLIRSKDAGENWTVVSTGGTQLLAMALLGNYVYIGTDTGSGNKIVRFTDDGSATVTLEDVLTLPTDEDVAIFGAGETASKIFMLGYKEAKTKIAKLYVYDGATWTTPYTEAASATNRGYYTVSRHSSGGVFYVGNDYGTPAGYGIKLTP